MSDKEDESSSDGSSDSLESEETIQEHQSEDILDEQSIKTYSASNSSRSITSTSRPSSKQYQEQITERMTEPRAASSGPVPIDEPPSTFEKPMLFAMATSNSRTTSPNPNVIATNGSSEARIHTSSTRPVSSKSASSRTIMVNPSVNTIKADGSANEKETQLHSNDQIRDLWSWSPNSRIMAVIKQENDIDILVFMSPSDEKCPSLKRFRNNRITAMSFHESDDFIVIGWSDGLIELLDFDGIDNCSTIQNEYNDEINKIDHSISFIEWSHDGKLLFTAEKGGIVKLWNLEVDESQYKDKYTTKLFKEFDVKSALTATAKRTYRLKSDEKFVRPKSSFVPNISDVFCWRKQQRRPARSIGTSDTKIEFTEFLVALQKNDGAEIIGVDESGEMQIRDRYNGDVNFMKWLTRFNATLVVNSSKAECIIKKFDSDTPVEKFMFYFVNTQKLVIRNMLITNVANSIRINSLLADKLECYMLEHEQGFDADDQILCFDYSYQFDMLVCGCKSGKLAVFLSDDVNVITDWKLQPAIVLGECTTPITKIEFSPNENYIAVHFGKRIDFVNVGAFLPSD
ncbi:hypothetical protein WR25_23568 [Diploscapter pachys]|uniref:IFT140 first beta-propeller domain-containing protein n=1 Tax=Diploscapter pachys TaxID=2018661 RepID=A0A2A2JFU0_9BILA|nr:hypothetical protein WR25_23568 [Diploscapter pachys]